ncbi:MAG: hypothetical protein OS130_04350 [Thermodesulfobacteriota bacterium]|nr:MAG: hypothetical protein OS130_04350 [Thermodesulfobacteriota bacterium]
MPRKPRLDAPGVLHHGPGDRWAGIARFLGVTTSAANRLANSEKLPETEKYVKLF